MKHKKSSKTQIKILTDEFTSILKPHSKYPQYQPAKTKPHHLSKHTKTNSTKINLVSTDVFKNLPKHSSSKSTEHNLLDQTKNSSDTATTVSKRYTNTNSNNKLNILKTNAHRDYMENFLKTVNKSINKNKSFILTNKTSNAHNITLMSGNVFANKKKFNVTNTNTNNGGYCNSSSNKKKKKNVVSTCSGKTSSNGVVEGNSNSNSNKYSNEVYTSCNKNGCNVQYKYNISNNVMDYHSSSLISEESVFSSNKHSITNTHNSSSLKYLTQVSNKYSSNNNSISNEQDYVSYTYSDDEVSCRKSSRNKLVLKEGNNTSIYDNNSNSNNNNYKCSNNSNNIFKDLHFQQNQLISSINQDDFRSFYNELNRKLFGNAINDNNTNTNTNII